MASLSAIVLPSEVSLRKRKKLRLSIVASPISSKKSTILSRYSGVTFSAKHVAWQIDLFERARTPALHRFIRVIKTEARALKIFEAILQPFFLDIFKSYTGRLIHPFINLVFKKD
jgi:hypothetical protein